MKAYLIDTEKNTFGTVNVDGLDDYYRLIRTDTIDIPTRYIGGKPYSIVCDDLGLLREDICFSAVRKIRGEYFPELVGVLIICGMPDEEGEMTDLTDDDVKNIENNIDFFGTLILQ